ncbi:SDR family NAD(P)-dependent oxidoreductase [Methylothermus subterraneus]|nr:short-chain dehydrogenase/reductase [uncultured Gammaproteobacteria bacterium]BAL54521.1 short-chain dehydrogenase/reductase [uncultured Gammaproteobacteria bacterium]
MAASKTVLITGVSKGLGRALAEELFSLGHRVLGCGRNRRALEELQGRWPQGKFAVVDVADPKAVAAWAKELLEAGECPDLLLNNAALINANAPLWEVPVEEFSAVVDVNLKGVFYVLKYFLPAMLRRQTGVVVNFSSGWGRSTSPEVAPYCATKWAIEGLTQALAQELPPGMAAVALNPGIVHTAMLDSCFGVHARQYPDPSVWAKAAAPFILELGPKHNGRSLAVPGF